MLLLSEVSFKIEADVGLRASGFGLLTDRTVNSLRSKMKYLELEQAIIKFFILHLSVALKFLCALFLKTNTISAPFVIMDTIIHPPGNISSPSVQKIKSRISGRSKTRKWHYRESGKLLINIGGKSRYTFQLLNWMNS